MKFIRILLLCFLTFSSSQCFSQTPSINWQRTLGASADDLIPIPVVVGQGVLIAGWSESNASGEKTEDSRGDFDFWLVRLNENGDILWDKTIGGIYSDVVTDAIYHNNKIYLLGYSWSPPSGEKTSENFGNRDFWLVCMNLQGDILWDKSYGGEQADNGYKIKPLNNGNLILFGTSSSGISGNKTDETNGLRDMWVLEVNDEGDIIRQKSIGSEEYDDAIDIAVASEGVYLLGVAPEGISGDKTDEGYNSDDLWLLKLDLDFNVLTDKCFGGESSEFPITGGIEFNNNQLYIAGTSQSEPGGNKTAPNYGGRDYWVIKCDIDLNIEWDKSFGGTGSDRLNSFGLYGENKLILFGHSASPISGTRTATNYGFSDGWMVITDLDGNELVQESYGGSLEESGSNFSINEAGEILLTMNSNSNESGVKTEDSRGGLDYWLLQLDNYVSVEEFKETTLQLKTFPNPFHDGVHFDLSEVKGSSILSIYSNEGRLVFRKNIQSQNEFTWNPKNTAGSLFFYELKTDEQVYRGKIIKR